MSRLGRILSALTIVVQGIFGLANMSSGAYQEAAARFGLCAVVALVWIIMLHDKKL